MEFQDALEDMAVKTQTYRDSLATEEATKNALVMPFIQNVLGYDVFDPSEVVPEFVADVGLKRGEKVDYAIKRGGEVQMVIEAKKVGEPLSLTHADQLVRYFHVTNARIGVLTNGQVWQFYTDLDRPNIMDQRPFLQIDLLDIDASTLPELRKLTKDVFDLDAVLASAGELKYVGLLKRVISSEFDDPSEELLRMLISRVFEGNITARVREQFDPTVRRAMSQFLVDRVNARLKSAFQGTTSAIPPASEATPKLEATKTEETPRDEIETTQDEIEGFMIVRAIAVADVDHPRVTGRDQKSYFAVLLDDNNRKPLCRLHFNRQQKYLGLLDENKVESRVPIDSVSDIYLHAESIREAARRYA